LTKEFGGQMAWIADIENYSGFSLINGAELTSKFKEHLQSIKEDLELKEGTEVVNVEKTADGFAVYDKTGQQYSTRAVIIASGKNPRHLDVPGEDKFFGHGVAVCATCDAPLYKGRDVAVVGGGNSAMDALLALSRVANKIYSINMNPQLIGDEILKTKITSSPNISFYNNAKTLEILGEQFVTGIKIKKGDAPEEILPVNGIFVEIGYVPSNAFDHLTEKNQHGEIKVDQNLQTNIPGLFAAGDINDAWGEQIVIAAGEGSKAALAAADYLNKLK
ncbi:MAG: FAD-dependent oxidoreductase, partial [Candidatus Doudnabacteria bacterium]|nr:FAD-dependent oxidoreductase [Candidatus Doudnabacteria bacterium]